MVGERMAEGGSAGRACDRAKGCAGMPHILCPAPPTKKADLPELCEAKGVFLAERRGFMDFILPTTLYGGGRHRRGFPSGRRADIKSRCVDAAFEATDGA